MKKRLRKKLHKGEFQELGFNLEFDYTGDADNEINVDRFYTAFIDAVESIGLEVGGGGYKQHSYFVARYRGSVSDQQRQALINWLEQYPDVANIIAGPLVDAWHGWDKE